MVTLGIVAKAAFDSDSILRMHLSALAPDPRNPRKMTDEARAGLGVSLEEFGDLSGIVFNDRTGQIVGAHQRLERLRAAGAIEVVRDGSEGYVLHPKTGERFHVRFVDWDETKQRMANLVANNPHIAGDFTEDAVAQLKELEDVEGFAELELGALEADLAAELGIDDEETGGNSDPDEVPDKPAEPLSKRGDLWLLGEHRLMCGDSTSETDVARLMNGERAGLMNTDPPYGIDYSKLKDGIPWSGFKNHQEQWGDIQNDTLTSGPELQKFLEQMIRTAVVHLKDDCAFYFWHPMLTQGTFFAAAAAADILIHRQIVWKKPGFVLTRSGQYHWAHELCFYGWVHGKPCPWYGEKNQTSVWELGRDGDAGQHPTQKPVELFKIPMLNHTHSGDVVYEPFSGSGSQLIAAEQLGRRCYAMELEPKYVDVAVARWEKFTGKKAVRANV